MHGDPTWPDQVKEPSDADQDDQQDDQQDDDSDASGGGFSLMHVPIKRKGSRKR